MDIGIISSRYAKALLKYATEKGENEEVYHSLMLLGESFIRIPKLRDTLNNPVLNDEKKYSLLNMASGNTQSECLKQFFRLMIRKHRISMAQFIAQSYVSAYRKQQHLIHSKLTVPVALDDATKERLKGLVKAKTNNEVEFVVDIDPSIIGGFVLEYDTYSFDASIRTKLNRMKKQLLANDNKVVSK